MNARQDLDELRSDVATPEALAKALARAGVDVRLGLFRPDYGLPEEIIASCLEGREADEDPDAGAIIKKKLSDYIKEGKLPILKDLKGRVLAVEDFPQNGDELTDDRSMPIIERLRQRLLENPSSGGIAACFEHHVHYGLGKSDRLTDAQSRFLASVCALANRRPHSIIWLSRFVEQHLDSPQRIRDLLTIIDVYRRSLPAAIRKCSAEALEELVEGRRWRRRLRGSSLHILVVGFSRSAMAVVSGLAERSSEPVYVSIADVQQPGRWPDPTSALRTIGLLGNVVVVNDRVCAEGGPIRVKGLDYVVTGFKALSIRAGEVSFVVSGPCARLLKASARFPMVLSGGLDKVWPSGASGEWNARSAPGGGKGDEVWDIGKAAWVVTEEGMQRPDSFAELKILKALSNARDIEMFHALLIARGRKSYKRLLASIPDKSDNRTTLSNMPDSNTLFDEQWRLIKWYKAEMSRLMGAKGSQDFNDARDAFRRLVEDDDKWFAEYDGKYVAVLAGAEAPSQAAAANLADAIVVAREKWPDQIFYVGKVLRPLPPKTVTLPRRLYVPQPK